MAFRRPRAGGGQLEQSIIINIAEQSLQLLRDGRVLRHYAVSTAKTGAGEQSGSGCTPRGAHRVRAKIGAGCASGTVFVGRRPTGEVYADGDDGDHYDEQRDRVAPDRVAPDRVAPDRVLTRVLWLCGCERGKNRFGAVDTMRRYIYIHGCVDSAPMGVPLSHGCIRMRNADIIELFDLIDAGIAVSIVESAPSPCAPTPNIAY